MSHRPPRGFRYALEPLRQVTAWDIDQLRLDHATALLALEQATAQAKSIGTEFDATLAHLRKPQTEGLLVGLGFQQACHAYLAQLQKQSDEASAEVKRCQHAVNAIGERLADQRNRAEGLDRDRARASGEHALAIARREQVLADDYWFQRQHWRSTP